MNIPKLEFVTNSDALREFAENSLRVGRFKTSGGNTHEWLLDCRKQLGEPVVLTYIAKELSSRLNKMNISQIAGAGFGSFLLIGALITKEHLSGAVLRPVRKEYGIRSVVEGCLNPKEPVCLIDDILNSGNSALRAVKLLNDFGFDNVHHLTILNYRWGRGMNRLNSAGIKTESLIDVLWHDRPKEHRPNPRQINGILSRWIPWIL